MDSDKTFWTLVNVFIKKKGHKPIINISDINGSMFNYLHIVFLVLRIKVYPTDKTKDYNKLVSELPKFLHQVSASFSTIFNALSRNAGKAPEPELVEEIKRLIREIILPLSKKHIDNIFKIQPLLKNIQALESFGVLKVLEPYINWIADFVLKALIQMAGQQFCGPNCGVVSKIQGIAFGFFENLLSCYLRSSNRTACSWSIIKNMRLVILQIRKRPVKCHAEESKY